MTVPTKTKSPTIVIAGRGIEILSLPIFLKLSTITAGTPGSKEPVPKFNQWPFSFSRRVKHKISQHKAKPGAPPQCKAREQTHMS